MASWIHKSMLVTVTMACVLVVFVAPTIDLPDSALRASQIAYNLMACIAFLRWVSAFALVLVFFFSGSKIVTSPAANKSAPVLCTFLC